MLLRGQEHCPRAFKQNAANFAALLFACLISFAIDSTSALADERYPGGTTSKLFPDNRHLFSHPAANIDLNEGLNFKVGKAVFEKIWVFAPSSTTASDGLGPLYNARSCSRCHIGNGRGEAPFISSTANVSAEIRPISLFVRLSVPPDDTQRQQITEHHIPFVPEPVYGAQLQGFAYPDGKAEGRLEIRYTRRIETFEDGQEVELLVPEYQVTQLAYGPLHQEVMLSPRIAPVMIGLGLLENIDPEQILKHADPEDSNQDGISGKPRWVKDLTDNQIKLGRFGWKAGAPDLEQQNAAALFNDIGIGSALFPAPWGECTSQQTECRKQRHGNTERHDHLEASARMTDVLLHYTRLLAVPARHHSDQASVREGEKLFASLGCPACHQPAFETKANASHPALASQKIWPYTDLLLHDMGAGLADNRPEGNANGREWRTAPLWGLGSGARLAKNLGKDIHYLHDGRARNLLEAILWHGGEAETSKQKVLSLNARERARLIAFLESL